MVILWYSNYGFTTFFVVKVVNFLNVGLYGINILDLNN